MKSKKVLEQERKMKILSLETCKEALSKKITTPKMKEFIKNVLVDCIVKEEGRRVFQSRFDVDQRIFECPHCNNEWQYTNVPDDFNYCASCGGRLKFDD